MFNTRAHPDLHNANECRGWPAMCRTPRARVRVHTRFHPNENDNDLDLHIRHDDYIQRSQPDATEMFFASVFTGANGFTFHHKCVRMYARVPIPAATAISDTTDRSISICMHSIHNNHVHTTRQTCHVHTLWLATQTHTHARTRTGIHYVVYG